MATSCILQKKRLLSQSTVIKTAVIIQSTRLESFPYNSQTRTLAGLLQGWPYGANRGIPEQYMAIPDNCLVRAGEADWCSHHSFPWGWDEWQANLLDGVLLWHWLMLLLGNGDDYWRAQEYLQPDHLAESGHSYANYALLRGAPNGEELHAILQPQFSKVQTPS